MNFISVNTWIKRGCQDENMPALLNSVLNKKKKNRIYYLLDLLGGTFFAGLPTNGDIFLHVRRPPLSQLKSEWVRSVSQWRVNVGVRSSRSFLSTVWWKTSDSFSKAVFDFTHFAPEPRRHQGNKNHCFHTRISTSPCAPSNRYVIVLVTVLSSTH